MDNIKELIKKMCPKGVQFMIFSEIVKHGGFKQVPANIMQNMILQGTNEVRLLPLSNNTWYTTKELAGENICEGEVISAGIARYANLKYWNGKFVSSNNHLFTSKNKSKLLVKFLYYLLTDCIQKFYPEKATYPTLDINSLMLIKIPVPPIEVQDKIVEILDKFSSLEAELEAELEARKKQYEYYKNKLLTFPEGGGIRMMKISEIGKFYSGLTGKTKDDFSNGNSKLITYMNVFDNISLNIDIGSKVKISENEKQNTIEYSDVIFTGSSETPLEVGMTSVLTKKTNEKLYLNSFCFGLRIENKNLFNPDFLKFLFRSKNVREQIIKTAFGVTRFNVSKKLLSEVIIPIPHIDVQNTIAEQLNKFYEIVNNISNGLPKEIELRNKQYEFYRTKLLSFEEVNV